EGGFARLIKALKKLYSAAHWRLSRRGVRKRPAPREDRPRGRRGRIGADTALEACRPAKSLIRIPGTWQRCAASDFYWRLSVSASRPLHPQSPSPPPRHVIRTRIIPASTPIWATAWLTVSSTITAWNGVKARRRPPPMLRRPNAKVGRRHQRPRRRCLTRN